MSSSASPSTSALQKEFDELVNAMRNSQIPVFKKILEGKNGRELLSWKVRVSHQVMTPIELALKSFQDIENFRAFFDCIRRIGGNELLKKELSKDGCPPFASFVRQCKPDVVMFLLRTFFCLGEDFMRPRISFTSYDTATSRYPPMNSLVDQAHINTNKKDGVVGAFSLEDVALILGHFLKKFDASPQFGRPFRGSTSDFENYFRVRIPFSEYQKSLIADFEKLAKEEEEQFEQQRATKQEVKNEVKQEIKNEETEEEQQGELSFSSRQTLESKLRVAMRELELEKSAHEFTKEQLRIALKLADSVAGTRRQREEDADEEDEAPAPAPKKEKKAARKVSKKAK